MRIAKCDLQEAVGTLQLCTGQNAGGEAAVHLFIEAVIIVYASNAFNRLNRQLPLSTVMPFALRCPQS